MLREITRELENVYGNALGCWDVIAEVEVEFDEPDPSVGYTGGWTVVGWTFAQFVELQGTDCVEVNRFSLAQMESRDESLCNLVKAAADKLIEVDYDSIVDDAAQEAADEYDDAQESKAEARRETIIERRFSAWEQGYRDSPK